MKIVLFAHPKFLGSQSMPRYAKMLAEGMQQKGHEVVMWEPKPFFYKLPFNEIKKGCRPYFGMMQKNVPQSAKKYYQMII